MNAIVVETLGLRDSAPIGLSEYKMQVREVLFVDLAERLHDTYEMYAHEEKTLFVRDPR
jgi:hypothetical protein